MSTAATTKSRPAAPATAVADAWVLTRRNLITYIRKPDLLVFSTIQPVMFVLLFVYVFGGAFKAVLPSTIPYVDFLMPGIFVQTAIFSALQTGVGLADDLQKGLIDRFRSLPMARSAVLAGRTLADTVAIIVQIFLMLVVAYLVGFRLHSGIGHAVLALAVTVGVGYAFTWVAAFAGLSLKSVEAVQASTFTIVFPFVFASSAFTPVSTFPSWLQGWAHINPVTIWVDTVRLLTLGDAYVAFRATPNLAAGFPADPIASLGTLLVQSAAWFGGIFLLSVFLGVRIYRRT
jgi:ABC-type multidrug transport system permease subunit